MVNDYDVSEDSIRNILINLDVRKSRGPVEIPPIFYKNLSTSLSKSISVIFSNIKRLRQFPARWKIGCVSPQLKKGSPSSCNNYRPVTLLNIIRQVFEKCVFASLKNQLVNNVSQYQHGFLPRKSLTTNLLTYLDKVYDAYDNSNTQIFAVYMDFAKTFDTVPHSTLLKKLGNLGIKGKLLDVIASYLHNRKQFVRFNGHESFLLAVLSGIRQGSLLRPILFVIFINDLPDRVFNSTISLFADDLKMLFNDRRNSMNENNYLQEDVNNVYAWIVENGMSFAEDKSYSLLFRGESHVLCIGDSELKAVNGMRYLGVLVSSNLSWSAHMETRIAKANGIFQMIRRSIASSTDTSVKLSLYRSLIVPILVYASPCWFPAQTDLKHWKMSRKESQSGFLVTTMIYNDQLLKLNILPISFYLELIDLLTFSSILNDQYNFDWHSAKT